MLEAEIALYKWISFLKKNYQGRHSKPVQKYHFEAVQKVQNKKSQQNLFKKEEFSLWVQKRFKYIKSEGYED